MNFQSRMRLLLVKNLIIRIDNQTIVEDLNFELQSGERLSIFGPNGAGKTVLLKALLKLIPYSGEIVWSPEARLGYVPQKIDADRHLPLTYRDLFASKCHVVRVGISEIDPIAQSVGLTKQMLRTPVGHLSGGQFQRGLIGFALIGKPNVLLLDEPTSSLDETGEEHIYDLIHRLQNQYKLAVITVSHDLSFFRLNETNESGGRCHLTCCASRPRFSSAPEFQSVTGCGRDIVSGNVAHLATGKHRHTDD
jgi:zinc transport system ATP-binding protein